MKTLEKNIGLRGTTGTLVQVKRSERVAMYQNNITGVVEVFRVQTVRASGIECEIYPLDSHFGTTAFSFTALTQGANDLYARLNNL